MEKITDSAINFAESLYAGSNELQKVVEPVRNVLHEIPCYYWEYQLERTDSKIMARDR